VSVLTHVSSTPGITWIQDVLQLLELRAREYLGNGNAIVIEDQRCIALRSVISFTSQSRKKQHTYPRSFGLWLPALRHVHQAPLILGSDITRVAREPVPFSQAIEPILVVLELLASVAYSVHPTVHGHHNEALWPFVW
jgi:hypothetical protein